MQTNLVKTLRVIGLFGLGAAVMYIADPQHGAKRRGDIRGKLRHGGRAVSSSLVRSCRHLGNQARGLAAEVMERVRREESPEDDILLARVRARIGHVIAHPHAVAVSVDEGRISLSGTITSREAPRLLKTIAATRGVVHIDNHLAVRTRGAAEATH